MRQRETVSRNTNDGYYTEGRRSRSADERGRVARYIYDSQSRLMAVMYPWSAEKAEADRKEAEEAGLYFTLDKGYGQRHIYTTAELSALKELLNRAFPGLGNAVSQTQTVWREAYAYDRNGNRESKTTPWGTVRYEYDAENRLARKGDIVYTNDKDGNTLAERGLRYEARYEYNGQNRMAYSEVTSHADRTHTVSCYQYDALGRRTLAESAAGQVMRTLYDGKGFEAIREGETFRDGSLTTRYAAVGAAADAVTRSNQPAGERYRWISEGSNERITADDGYTVEGGRYGGRGVTLYGNGEAVAVSYSSSTGSRSAYLGKDILGSVRTATDGTGAVEGRYEYDAFGTPYAGDLSGGMNLGYLGKPYDTATGLYNYGYRDYSPRAARFTTADPVRDGSNWYAYVNNDPVNYVDLWGLSASDGKKSSVETSEVSPASSVIEDIINAAKKVIDVVKDIDGKTRAAPMTVRGLVAGGALNLISWISGNHVLFEVENNAFSFNTGLKLFGGGAMTLGNVIIYASGDIEDYNKSTDGYRYDYKRDINGNLINVKLGDHEEAHTYQYQRYGDYMIPVLIGSAIINGGIKEGFASRARGSSFIEGFMSRSRLERDADDYAQRKIEMNKL